MPAKKSRGSPKARGEFDAEAEVIPAKRARGSPKARGSAPAATSEPAEETMPPKKWRVKMQTIGPGVPTAAAPTADDGIPATRAELKTSLETLEVDFKSSDSTKYLQRKLENVAGDA